MKEDMFIVCGQPIKNSDLTMLFGLPSFWKKIGIPSSFIFGQKKHAKYFCCWKISSPFMTRVFDKYGKMRDFVCRGIVVSVDENGLYDFFCIDSYTKPIFDENGECFGCRPVIDDIESQQTFLKLCQRIIGV